jgi:hypothetical protein
MSWRGSSDVRSLMSAPPRGSYAFEVRISGDRFGGRLRCLIELVVRRVRQPVRLGSIGDFAARRRVLGEAGDSRLLAPTKAQPLNVEELQGG